jgi:hypothetical protein
MTAMGALLRESRDHAVRASALRLQSAVQAERTAIDAVRLSEVKGCTIV